MGTDVIAVTIYDNFSSGRSWHYAHHVADKRFAVVRGDVNEREKLTEAMRATMWSFILLLTRTSLRR